MTRTELFCHGLAQLMQLPDTHPGATDREAALLRVLSRSSAEGPLVLERDANTLKVEGVALPLWQDDYQRLNERLRAHHLQRVEVQAGTSPAELLRLAGFLAAPPAAGEARTAADQFWNVRISFTAEATAAAAERGESDAEAQAIAQRLAMLPHASVERAEALLQELTELALGAAAEERLNVVDTVLRVLLLAERQTGDALLRAAIGRAIRQLGQPVVLDLFARQLPTAAARDQVLQVLQRFGEAGARAVIAQLMEAEGLPERRAFFDAVVRLRTGAPALLEALRHERWYVVRNAACLLGEMQAHEADEALVHLLENHPDERVREAAATALAQLKTPLAGEALRKQFRNRSPGVRLRAIRAYCEDPNTSAAALTLALDEETNDEVRLVIVDALGRFGSADAVQKLLSLAKPGHPTELRIAALQGLARARGRGVSEVLRGYTADAEPGVQLTARRVLSTLGRR